MNDLERDVRTVLEQDAERAPLVTQVPDGLRRNVRRREARTGLVSMLATVAVVALAAITVGALTPSHRATPAQPSPPAVAPVEISRGAVDGWDWVLSASEDGSCVALTDANGSTTLCPTEAETAALGDPRSNDLVGVTVREPGPPGPDSMFVFGIVSARVDATRVITWFEDAAEAATHVAPAGVEGSRGFFLSRFDGFPYPVVPDLVVDVRAGSSLLDSAGVERPSWAEPEVELVEQTASVTWDQAAPEGVTQTFTFGVWVDHMNGDQLCYPTAEDACGPASDPVPAWMGSGRGIEGGRVNTSYTGSGEGSAVGYGLFRDPIVSVRIKIEGQPAFDANTAPPPSSYPDAPGLYWWTYQGQVRGLSGRAVGLDAGGNVVDTAALGG